MGCTVTLYGIRNCSTVKKSMQWLDDHHVMYRFHDLRKDGFDQETLTRWIRLVGWEKLLNRSSMTFRQLPAEDKQSLNEGKAIHLMLANPTVIRRPVVTTERGVWVGFKPETYEAVFAAFRGY
ncbi:arsenate reductase [Saccharibacter floricola]|uniref:Arsenate reductase n=1 Tax=Saccharibacter floricola DSM 15669 TaxID=1123227 RepID=A0ABQ0NXP3_9PROT|nr:arsenate reductase [Saccharibacter floricola]GBQ05983.1 hypothetical protein AA15669_0730 [Saccharibacter floricola DSM 15669]